MQNFSGPGGWGGSGHLYNVNDIVVGAPMLPSSAICIVPVVVEAPDAYALRRRLTSTDNAQR